jgi:hypothetical protein
MLKWQQEKKRRRRRNGSKGGLTVKDTQRYLIEHDVSRGMIESPESLSRKAVVQTVSGWSKTMPLVAELHCI